MSLNWLFLDLNSFFASVEQAEDPSLRKKPVAVVPMLVDTTCCLAASYEAKAFGIKTGTSIRDAKRMCPGIRFVIANHKKYISYHKRIIDAVGLCIPISAVLSIDEMACQLMGREREEKNVVKMANEIKESIYQNVNQVLSCSIGVAPNRYLAKVASDMQKPDGLVLIKKEQIPSIFLKLKIRDFPGIGPQMEKRFFDYNCTEVEQLYQLSLPEMKKIWGGVFGEEFWQLIRGENLKEKITQRKTIGHSRVIAPLYRNNRDYIKSICMQLLTKTCIRLRDGKLYTREMHFGVKFINSQNDFSWDAKARFDETQNTLFLTSELEKILKKIPKGSILKIGITLTGLVEEKKHQLSLFEDLKAQPLMEAIDKINKKHKRNLVFPASSNLSNDKTPARIAFSRIPEENE